MKALLLILLTGCAAHMPPPDMNYLCSQINMDEIDNYPLCDEMYQSDPEGFFDMRKENQ